MNFSGVVLAFSRETPAQEALTNEQDDEIPSSSIPLLARVSLGFPSSYKLCRARDSLHGRVKIRLVSVCERAADGSIEIFGQALASPRQSKLERLRVMRHERRGLSYI